MVHVAAGSPRCAATRWRHGHRRHGRPAPRVSACHDRSDQGSCARPGGAVLRPSSDRRAFCLHGWGPACCAPLIGATAPSVGMPTSPRDQRVPGRSSTRASSPSRCTRRISAVSVVGRHQETGGAAGGARCGRFNRLARSAADDHRRRRHPAGWSPSHTTSAISRSGRRS